MRGVFVLLRIKESSGGDYTGYESDGDTLSDYFDEIKQYLINIIKTLKSTGSAWKMKFIIDLYYYYKKDDIAVEKEMFIQCVYGIIMPEINNHTFIGEFFKLVENKYKHNCK